MTREYLVFACRQAYLYFILIQEKSHHFNREKGAAAIIHQDNLGRS